MKRLFIILFVFAFSFNTNAQEDYMTSNEDSGYVEISINSDSEKPNKQAFESYKKQAKEKTIEKIGSMVRIGEGAVYKNKVYWLVATIESNRYVYYLAKSNFSFSSLELEKIKENDLNKKLNNLIIKK